MFRLLAVVLSLSVNGLIRPVSILDRINFTGLNWVNEGIQSANDSLGEFINVSFMLWRRLNFSRLIEAQLWSAITLSLFCFFFFAPFVFGTKLHTHTYEAIGISSHQLAFEYFGMESKFISMEFFDISIVLLLIGGCASQSIPFVVGLFHRTSSATVIGESLPHKLCMIITFVLHTTRLVWKLGIISIEPQRRLLSHLHTTHPFTPRYHRFKQSICAPPSTTRTESKALVQLYKQPISTTGDLSETRPDWKCDEHLLTDILQSTHAHSVLDDGVLSSFWFSPVSERANERTNKREPLRLKVFSAVRLDRRNGFSICL